MTGESKTEIILVALATGVLILLWARNRNGGAGTGTETLPILSHRSTPLPGAAPLFDIPAPVPGLTLDYTASPWSLPAPSSFALDAGTPSACNCSGSGGLSGSTFGAPSDMIAWLTGQPGLVQTANDGLNNWN